VAMASDLDRSASTLVFNPQYLAPVLNAKAAMRGLTEAPCSTARARWWRGTGLAFDIGLLDVSQDALRRANQGEGPGSCQ